MRRDARRLENWMPGILYLGVITLILCIALALKHFKRIRGAVLLNSTTLQVTTGTITYSDIHLSRRGKRWIRSPSYRYSVEYQYTVANNVYTSNLVDFSWIIADEGQSFAKSYIDRYPVGQRVRVFYFPDEPSLAVLEFGKEKNTIYLLIGLLIGLTFACIDIFLCTSYFIKRRAKPTNEKLRARLKKLHTP